MAPQKSPAFQFYPKDFMAGTATMSLQEVGAYMRLLCYAWDTGSVPNEGNERARIMVCSKAQEAAIWKKVGQKFVLQNDVYLNERMEDERKKQSEYRRRQSDRGKASAEARTNQRSNAGSTSVPTPVEPRPVDSRLQPEGNSSSSSSSSSSKETAKSAVSERTRPIISGESAPAGWVKIHGNHVTEFCDWVCLPEFIFAEFCRKSGQVLREDGGAGYVRGWALRVRQEWEGRPIGADGLKFWRDRWGDSHKTEAPKAWSAAEAITRALEAEKKAGAR